MKKARQKLQKFLLILLLAASAAMASAVPASKASASDKIRTDYDWQALYLYKLIREYVEWPEMTYAGDYKVVSLCIFGDNPAFAKAVNEIQSSFEKSKIKINIRQLDGNDSSGCNVAYIPRNKQDYKDIIASMANKPILTIAPIEGFAANRGMVEFVISETKDSSGATPLNTKVVVTLKLNNRTATASKLTLSPDFIETIGEANVIR